MVAKLDLSKPLEIAKRTAIFTAIGQIGSMFAGVMMTAMNSGLHGRTSLQGWQWVFIISTTHSSPLLPR
jgi:ACS family pantothenate transporter-like MFS transporter